MMPTLGFPVSRNIMEPLKYQPEARMHQVAASEKTGSLFRNTHPEQPDSLLSNSFDHHLDL